MASSKLTFQKLKAIPISIPPTLSEQQRFADYLFTFDDLIAAKARKVELFKEHKKVLMQQLFPRVD